MLARLIDSHRALATLGVLSAASIASGQFVGPIPPKPENPPEYVPSAAPPALPAPENEPLAPSIVNRNESGALVPLDTSPEEAALRAYPFKPEVRIRVETSLQSRARDMDIFVRQNLNQVLAAEAMRKKVAGASDFNALFEARDAVAAIRQERLFDRMQRDGAITPQQRVRLDECVRNYEVALKEQFAKDTDGDPTRQAILNLRQTYADSTREHFDALDRQLVIAAANAADAPSRLVLNESQQRLIRAFAAAPIADRTNAFRAFWNAVEPERRDEATTVLFRNAK